MSIYAPSMPALTEALGTSQQMVQLTLTVFFAGFAVSQLFYGPASDRFGRRRVLLGGLSLYVAASIACAFAPTIEVLIVGRLLQAIGACGGAAVARAVVRDLAERDQAVKVMAVISLVLGATPAVGPVAGGYLEATFGWQAAFVALTLFGVALMAGVTGLIPETNRHPDPSALNPGKLVGNIGHLLRNRVYVGYMAACALSVGGSFSFQAAAPFVFIDHLGVSPVVFGWALSPPVATYVLGSVLVGRIGTAIGLDRLILVGLGLEVLAAGGLAGLALAGDHSPSAVVAPHMLWMFGMALVLPCATAGAMAPFPRMAGAAWSLIGFGQMGVGTLGSVIVAVLPAFVDRIGLIGASAITPGLLLLVLASTASLLFYFLAWRAPAEDGAA